MKWNGSLFYLLTFFYFLVAGGYAIWFYISYQTFEPIGIAALTMTALMSLFLAFYLKNTAKRQGPVAEDLEDARIEDGESEIGFFAPWSWWPLFLGLFCSIAFAALAVGWWLFFIAVPLALVALIGFVFEHSRGQYAH
jgi:hypothetical protein